MPSNQPSDLPSLSPSTVLTSSYEYVGEGDCFDSFGSYYFKVIFNDVVTANACAVKCNDCVAGNVSGGSLRGFELGSSDQLCYCLMDSNASYTGSCAVSQVFEHWYLCGVGPVDGSDMSDPASKCYKIKAQG